MKAKPSGILKSDQIAGGIASFPVKLDDVATLQVKRVVVAYDEYLAKLDNHARVAELTEIEIVNLVREIR